jgi:hypothetical protein
MLTAQEQADLYEVISAALGPDTSIKSVQNIFNEQTLAIAEEAVVAAANCNANMKKLVFGLLGGTSILAKGWLRKILKKFSKELKAGDVKFRGYACQVVTANNFKTAIVGSVY